MIVDDGNVSALYVCVILDEECYFYWYTRHRSFSFRCWCLVKDYCL